MLYTFKTLEEIEQATGDVPPDDPVHLLLRAVKDLGISYMPILPDRAKTPLEPIPPHCAVLIDDGDLTIEALGLETGGPSAFNADSLRELVRSCTTVVVNGSDHSRQMTLTAIFGALMDRGMLIETSNHYAEWAQFVVDARGRTNGIVLSGPSELLPPEIRAQSIIAGADGKVSGL